MNVYSPDHIFRELERAAEDWTQAQLLADQMERTGEILLAKMILEAKDEGMAIGLCKEVARTRQEWGTHIRGEVIARNKAQRSKARYDNTKELARARQTEQATVRALTTRGGG